MYEKEAFIRDINEFVTQHGYDPVLVAKKAYKIYEEHIREIDRNLREKILDVANMEMGPEFELTEKEFSDFLKKI